MGVLGEALKQPTRSSGPWHRKAACVVYAYESPELAAQVLGFKVGAYVPRELRRECIRLPWMVDAHEWMSRERVDDIMRGRVVLEGLSFQDVPHYMQRLNRMSVWIPSPGMDHQHVVLLNPQHPDIHKLQVTVQCVDFSQPPIGGDTPPEDRAHRRTKGR